jgi:hypothetical protein
MSVLAGPFSVLGKVPPYDGTDRILTGEFHICEHFSFPFVRIAVQMEEPSRTHDPFFFSRPEAALDVGPHFARFADRG